MFTTELRYQFINVNCTTLFYKFVSATGVLFLFMSGKRQIIHLFLLKTFCAQASCQNNGTCQSGFTRKRYRCLCASGFIGHDCEKGNTCVIEMNFWFYHSGLFLKKVQDSESVVLMTHTEYDPLWVKRRMGAQVQFSCSFSQLWLSVLFTMNSKEFKPTSLSFGCLFLYFKDYPVSLMLQTHPRLGIQCRKKWATIFPLGSPSFYYSLASSLANADK